MSTKPDINACRRVIAGIGPDGGSKVVADGPTPYVKRASDYIDFAELWMTPSPPPAADEELVDTGADAPDALEPPDPRGTLLRMTVFKPDPSEVDFSALMHATKTVDYAIVISGEITCVLDEGEIALGPGDTIVQRGNRHAWSNRGTEDALVAFVMVGAPDHVTADAGWTIEK